MGLPMYRVHNAALNDFDYSFDIISIIHHLHKALESDWVGS